MTQPSKSIATPASTTRTRPDPPKKIPSWYPAWARELADLYFLGAQPACSSLHNGNVPMIWSRCPDGEEDGYCSLSEFLTTQVFGRWDIVLGYDPSQGLRPQGRSRRPTTSHDASTSLRLAWAR